MATNCKGCVVRDGTCQQKVPCCDSQLHGELIGISFFVAGSDWLSVVTVQAPLLEAASRLTSACLSQNLS